MNNETTKDQVRRLIAGIAPCYEKRPDLIKDDAYCFGFMVQVVELAIAEEREANAPKWIDVNESLPDSDEQVLVCTSSGVSYGYLDDGDDEGWVWILFQNADGEHNYDEPTHWMRTPLPAAPKDEVIQ